MFYGHSVGITSLMFAKEKPELILQAVKSLDEMGVACLSYKPIFFKELPREVIEYSESHDFPIFEISDDAFFEDIVLAIKKEVGQDMTESEIENSLEKVLAGELGESDMHRLKQRIAPELKRYVQVVCFVPRSDEEMFDRDHFVKYTRRLALTARYSGRTALCRFRGGGFVFLSRDVEEGDDMDVLLQDVAISVGMPLKEVRCGMSLVLRTDLELDTAIRQAYWAQRAAKVEEYEIRRYQDMGVYRLLAPEMNSPTLLHNAEAFLRPLLEHTEEDEEDRSMLLETTLAYVKAYKNVNLAAEMLFCHKNTVRYRMQRVHELLAPSLSENDFRECLTLSVLVVTLSRDSWEM
jgi:DNA-binding PucR family transcriptional regulator